MSAFFLTIFVSACAPSVETAVEPIPRLDPRDAAPCALPDVGPEAIAALTRHRVALAACKRRHANVVAQYEDARITFGAARR